jgi:hypothetical protein
MLMLWNLLSISIFSCTYPSTKDGELVTIDKIDCIDSAGKISNSVLVDLYFEKNGLSWCLSGVNQFVYYVTRNGSYKQTEWFDNGPDIFKNGLVRMRSFGKIGFMDSSLNVVILPKWDFAHPFSNGKAKVGNICKFFRIDASEHSGVECKFWQEIDISGNMIKK